MEKFIPYEKLSKKARRALDRKQRGSWGAVKPVSRREENPKAYKRHPKYRDPFSLKMDLQKLEY